MNIIDLQERLKDFPEQALMQEMQAPSGMAPQFLVLSELKRRKRMRDDFQRAQAADMKTVAEEAITGAGVPQAGIMQMAGAMAPNTNVAQDTGINDAMERTPTQAPQPQGIMSMARGGYVKKMQEGRSVGGGGFGTNVEYNYETFLREMNLSDSPDARDAFRRYQDYVNAQRPYRESIQQPTVVTQAPEIPSISDVSADISAFMPGAGAEQPVLPVLDRPSGAALANAVYSPRGVVADFDATQELPLGEGEAARLAEGIGVGKAADIPSVDEEGPVPAGLDVLREAARGINIGAAADAGRLGLNLPAYMAEGALPAGAMAAPQQPTLREDLAAQIADLDRRIAETTDPNMRRALENNRTSRYAALTAVAGVEGAAQAINEAVAAGAKAVGQGAAKAGAGVVDIAGTLLSPIDVETAASLYGVAESMRPEDRVQAEAAQTAKQEADRAAEAARMIGINEIPDRARMITDDGGMIPPAKTPVVTSTVLPEVGAGAGAGTGGGVGGVGGFGPIESRIAQMLQEREQSAAADKWMALAQTGLALMASRQPTLGGAIGEAGLAGIGAMRQARSQYDKDVLGLLEMQAGIQRAKASGARSAAPKATSPSEINAALDYLSGVADRQATVVSVNELGQEVTTKDYSRVSPAVASQIKQLEDQYMALLRGGSVDLNLVQ